MVMHLYSLVFYCTISTLREVMERKWGSSWKSSMCLKIEEKHKKRFWNFSLILWVSINFLLVLCSMTIIKMLLPKVLFNKWRNKKEIVKWACQVWFVVIFCGKIISHEIFLRKFNYRVCPNIMGYSDLSARP